MRTPAREGAAWTADTDLRVVSWNLWIGGGDLERMLAEELGFDCSRAASSADRAVAPFVVLLQEVWRYSDALPEVEAGREVPWPIDPETRTGDIVDAARRCGLALVYVPSARNGPDDGPRPKEDKGNAVLSNVPLTSPLAIDLPVEGGRKVAVAATVAAPDGGRVRVVAVHLDVASTLFRTVFSGFQTRGRQAMGLVDGLDRAEEAGYTVDATVVGADMNTWAGNESALTRIRAAFPDSPPWDGRNTRGPFPTDHILYRAREEASLTVEEYVRVEDAYASDHHARALLLRYVP
jgi:endonuclease/exonuclease/phosphatase family metal-dependent hydrolase